MATPEVILGASLLALWVSLGTQRGLTTIVIAHVMFNISFVVVTVRARIAGFNRALEEAAMDLCADEWTTFRKVTLPLIFPGILAAALLAFALSIDDYVITSFVAGQTRDLPAVGLRRLAASACRPRSTCWARSSLLVAWRCSSLLQIWSGAPAASRSTSDRPRCNHGRHRTANCRHRPPPPSRAAAWLALRDGVAPVWARYTDLVVERGSGSWIETIDGERYLDYTSGIGVTNTGHAHPRVAAAIAEQAAKIIHAQQNILYHQPGLELHDRLPRLFPAPPRPRSEFGLFLSNSGAEAIEASVKLAKIATRRPLIVAFRGGFHGRTHGTMALTSSGVKYRGHYEPLPGGVHFVPFPDPLRLGDGARQWRSSSTMAAIDELFATMAYPDDVAAFLVEPILGEGGYVVPSDGFLPALREVADQHGILLIVDEIQTGYGRTGRFFATEWTAAVARRRRHGQGHRLRACRCRASWPAGRCSRRSRPARTVARTVATPSPVPRRWRRSTCSRTRAWSPTPRGRVSGCWPACSASTAGKPYVAEVRGRGLMAAIEFAEPGTLQPRPGPGQGAAPRCLRPQAAAADLRHLRSGRAA